VCRHFVGECIEQTRRQARSGSAQPRLPIAEGEVECITKLLELAEANLQGVQLRPGHGVDLSTGGAPTPPFGEHQRQLAERESNAKSCLNDAYLALSCNRKPAGSSDRPWRCRQESQSFVVAKGVWAQPCSSSELTDWKSDL
jgi:hypothetical protein